MKGPNSNTSRMMAGNVAVGKKLVIKPFAVQPKLPENLYGESWSKLQLAVVAIFEKNSSKLSKEELYRAVEDLCMHKHAQRLYDDLSAELRGHIVRQIGQLLPLLSVNDADFLVALDHVWSDHCSTMGTIRNVFLYLDRAFALHTVTKSIWDVGLAICRDALESADLQQKIVAAIFFAVRAFRDGDRSWLDALGHCTHMLISLDLYLSLLEPSLLHEAEVFFKNEGQRGIQSLDAARYLILCEKRLNECSELCMTTLDVHTKRPMIAVIERELLKPHTSTLLERDTGGLRSLLDDDRKDDLRRMCIYFERVEMLEPLKNAFAFYLRQSGESIIAKHFSNGAVPAGNEKEFVEALLALFQKFDSILKYSFGSKEIFLLAFKLSFEHVLNMQQKQSAEQLARYVDRKLRGEKGTSDGDMEVQLDQVLKLFRFLQEKDIFEAFYKKYLSRRLLLQKSASVELEKHMLSRLKAECGPAFTVKLEGMFTDMDLSRQCAAAFATHCANSQLGSTDRVQDTGLWLALPELSISVLTQGNWPSTSSSTTSLRLPVELTALSTRFETFFQSNFQGRRLSWEFALDRCIVSARFPKGKKELDISLFQSLVLRCFNFGNGFTILDISQRTGIEKEELRRTLQSLACGMVGTRVLSKEPKGKDVADSDIFNFNDDFSNKMFRIKINTIQAKEETNDESNRTLEEVARDRSHQIDAAVVRIMKSRKRLAHASLVSETMTQLRFPASNADVKKRIESLIERDFLERDSDESNVYNYLA